MDSVASFGGAEPESAWAERVSRHLLEPMGSRWRHTLGVVERARVVGEGLERDQAELLLAAAYLHDVGYAPELEQTGFHPVDGARFVKTSGHERLAGLVAYHSGAETEAGERGLMEQLSEFEDERSLVSKALTYCDLTTDSEGRHVEPGERLAEIRDRYGLASSEGRAAERSAAGLLDDVRAVEALLPQTGVENLTRGGTGTGGG